MPEAPIYTRVELPREDVHLAYQLVLALPFAQTQILVLTALLSERARTQESLAVLLTEWSRASSDGSAWPNRQVAQEPEPWLGNEQRLMCPEIEPEPQGRMMKRVCKRPKGHEGPHDF
jgi:hypothetical protein